MKIRKKNKQKSTTEPKGEPSSTMKDLKDTEIETLWFGF